MRGGPLELFASVDRFARVLAVRGDRLPRPIRQRIERIVVLRVAREIESQFPAHDQLFQKFIGDQFVLLRMLLHGQRHFE